MPYEKDGKKFPRCTNIISDCTNSSGALTQWAANMVVEWIKENVGQEEIGIYPVTDDHLNDARFNFRKVSQKALDIGSEVHDLIESYLKNQDSITIDSQLSWSKHEQANQAFQAFLAWWVENDIKPISLEQTVWGDRWAGTLDIHCFLNGKEYVIDWKTSKNHYPAQHGPQIAAYRSCIPSAEGCGILRIDKETGLPDWKDYSKRYEKDLATFNAMVELYILRHPIIARRMQDGKSTNSL